MMSRRVKTSSTEPDPPTSATRRRSSAATQIISSQQSSQLLAAAHLAGLKSAASKRTGSKRNEQTQLNDDMEGQQVQPIWPNYSVGLYQEGARHMDTVFQICMKPNSRSIELKMRPVSGVRNHIKRNLIAASSQLDVIRETDLVQRIASFSQMKRLDLSFNNLHAFPRQLCNLELLESLNLSNNMLQDNDFPADVDRFQNLVELILDNNKLKKLPKALTKFKRLSRLSVRSNSLSELKNLDNFKKLKHLILDNNCLSSVDESLKPLDRLEILSIANNQLNSLSAQLFRHTFKHLRRIDVSLNQLQSIASDLFMLPHMESINLSRNQLTRLPNLPSSYVRPNPMFSIDLSANQITCYNDYLLLIALNVDLSANRIKVIPLKAFKKLGERHFRTRSLKIDDNPLVDPPVEYCKYGLRDIHEYLVDNYRRLQINKGFKLFLLGDNNSGKTALAHALEDYHTQTNLVEQMFSGNNDDDDDDDEDYNESTKFIDIHEFLFRSNDPADDQQQQQASSDTFITSPTKSQSRITQSRRRSVSTRSSRSAKKSSPPKQSSKMARESIDAFKDPIPSSVVENKTRVMNVHIYDANGSLTNYAHILDLFLDKSSLIILCIDATKFACLNESSDELSMECERNLKGWLDLILLKMSKNISFHIIPVLTKCDKMNKKSSLIDEIDATSRVNSAVTLNNSFETSSSASLTMTTSVTTSKIAFLATKIESLIASHISDRLNDIRLELKKIESLGDISPSQSDRLKQLVQTRANLNPNVHKSVLCVSALKMDGIASLTDAIRSIVYNNPKQFVDVNKKVPTFWLDMEEFACNVLSTMSYRKLYNDDVDEESGAESNLNALFLNYGYYKDRLVQKYGMSQLVEHVTRYLHASGKIIWLSDTDSKVLFPHPNLLFNMLYVLFRDDFARNFADQHIQLMRARLLRGSFELTESYLMTLQQDLVDKGKLRLDLLKLLWFPILVIDSTHSVLDLFTLLSFHFLIGYPDESKERLKSIYAPYLANKGSSSTQQSFDFDEPQQQQQQQSRQSSASAIVYERMIIPHYLPTLDLDYQLKEIQENLLAETNRALEAALACGLKTETGQFAAKISQRYEFPWGLVSGLFERFATSCIITSDFYAKIHYKNLLLAYNEDNTIGFVASKRKTILYDLIHNHITIFFYLYLNVEHSSILYHQTSMTTSNLMLSIDLITSFLSSI